MDRDRKCDSRGSNDLAYDGEVSRRDMVAGTAAIAAVAAVLPFGNAAYAEQRSTDMMAFLLLSGALTGVSLQTLAPELGTIQGDILNTDPGVDPINIKDEYFGWISDKKNDPTSSFGKLLQLAKDNRQSLSDIIPKVNGSSDDVKFFARSIVLLWYLGAWYKPDDLKNHPDDLKNHKTLPQVISAKAYTQGLVWQIAGAHPMGYSNLQFGYWSRDPHDTSVAPSGPFLFDSFNPAQP